MMLNKDSIYTVRGYGENGQPKLICEAKRCEKMTPAVMAYTAAWCQSIDVDVVSTGRSCYI